MAVLASPAIARDRDRRAVRRLLTFFSRRTGRWSTPTGEAWQPAVAVEAVLNTYERTRDVAYLNVIEKSFQRYRRRRSPYYDDDGWYLNAWLRAYDVTGDPKYLDEARALFVAMSDGWDDACGGGLWWRRDRTYKNAITAELFLLAAARLHRRTRAANTRYLDWAHRAWRWFETSGMINPSRLVNDGLDARCANNGQPTWTYNQGVILDGLAELWRATGDATLLLPARHIADAAIETLVHPDGVLREPNEPRIDNKDAHAFKGILAQGLARLYAASRAEGSRYRAFLLANADALWAAGRDRDDGFGALWRGPAHHVNAATQASAALLLGHVALLDCAPPAVARAPDDGFVCAVGAATLAGLSLETVHAGSSGAGYVAGWHRDGQYVSFDVEGVEARTHTLTFSYAAGAGDAYRYLEVNGVGRAATMLFAGTGGWELGATVSFDVPLRAGTNAVSLIYDSSRGSSNFINLEGMRVR